MSATRSIDLVAFAPEHEVERLTLRKGTMNLVDQEESVRIRGMLDGWQITSGGSAANTAVGIASLGGNPAFAGAVGDDELGEYYLQDLELAGVRCSLATVRQGDPPPATGRCHIVITPDADRTMATYLGAATCVPLEAVQHAPIDECRIVYIEGYLYDDTSPREALGAAIGAARLSGARVAISLSDPFVVTRHKDLLAPVVANVADIIFANEAEILMLTRTESIDEAIEAIRRPGLVAFLTLGAQGALVVSDDSVAMVPAVVVDDVVDTTGAGDLFAAGALYGLCNEMPLEACATLGALTAAEIISHVGARPARSLKDLAASVAQAG